MHILKAVKMNLFKSKSKTSQIELEPLKISTPLGDLLFNLESEKSLQNIKISKIETVNPQTTIFSWNLKNCNIEFLKLKFIPDLPSGMYVDRCICGIWRIKALTNVEKRLTFSCTLKSDFTGSPNTGERLECQEFENEDFILSIGSEDQECFMYRAELENWFPKRFYLEQTEIEFEYSSSGIEVVLPNLFKDEEAQLHFIVAWSSKKNPEISTWYAVDQPSEKLLQVADIV